MTHSLTVKLQNHISLLVYDDSDEMGNGIIRPARDSPGAVISMSKGINATQARQNHTKICATRVGVIFKQDKSDNIDPTYISSTDGYYVQPFSDSKHSAKPKYYVKQSGAASSTRGLYVFVKKGAAEQREDSEDPQIASPLNPQSPSLFSPTTPQSAFSGLSSPSKTPSNTQTPKKRVIKISQPPAPKSLVDENRYKIEQSMKGRGLVVSVLESLLSHVCVS